MGKMYYMTETMSCYRSVLFGKDNWTSLKNRVNKPKTIADIESNMLIQIKEYGLNININPHFYRNVVLYAICFFVKKRTFENFKLVLFALRVCPNKIYFTKWLLKVVVTRIFCKK